MRTPFLNLEHIMRIFQGTLSVKAISGRRGVFNVGKLLTDIGEFTIKDKALEQFDPGVYEGEFMIELIEAQATRWKGGYFNEVVAKIADGGYNINQDGAGIVDTSTQSEPDPLDAERERNSRQVAAPFEASHQEQGGSYKAKPKNLAVSLAMDLSFYDAETLEAIQVLGVVKLDSSIEDRELFRKQRDGLKALGYRFNFKEQNWYKPSEVA
jgi:Protein of unknown function (DUF3275)